MPYCARTFAPHLYSTLQTVATCAVPFHPPWLQQEACPRRPRCKVLFLLPPACPRRSHRLVLQMSPQMRPVAVRATLSCHRQYPVEAPLPLRALHPRPCPAPYQASCLRCCPAQFRPQFRVAFLPKCPLSVQHRRRSPVSIPAMFQRSVQHRRRSPVSLPAMFQRSVQHRRRSPVSLPAVPRPSCHDASRTRPAGHRAIPTIALYFATTVATVLICGTTFSIGAVADLVPHPTVVWTDRPFVWIFAAPVSTWRMLRTTWKVARTRVVLKKILLLQPRRPRTISFPR